MSFDWTPVITHGLTAVGSFFAGMSKTLGSWLSERRKNKQLEQALYKEFCHNLDLARNYAESLSPNPNYAREFPEIEQWLRKEVYEAIRKDNPVALHHIKGATVIGETYMMMDIISKKDRSEHRKRFAQLRSRIQSPSQPLDQKLFLKYHSLRPEPYWVYKFRRLQLRHKRLAWLFARLGWALKRNNPSHEGVYYHYDPFYRLAKSLWTGMYGKPVVYDEHGIPRPLGTDWKPLNTPGFDFDH
jgi:hypothetical protein